MRSTVTGYRPDARRDRAIADECSVVSLGVGPSAGHDEGCERTVRFQGLTDPGGGAHLP
jgi:hypothetical protein